MAQTLEIGEGLLDDWGDRNLTLEMATQQSDRTSDIHPFPEQLDSPRLSTQKSA